MRFSSYSLQVAWRIAALMLAMLGLAFSVAYQREYTYQVVFAAMILLLTISLLRYTQRFTRDLATFLEGFRFAEFQQKLAITRHGGNFDDLARVLDDTAMVLEEKHTARERQALYYQSLVQNLPLPFLVLQLDGRAEIINAASRRVFNVPEIRHSDDLEQFGASFQRDVLQIKPGESLLSSVRVDGREEHFILAATSIGLEGNPCKLVALQNVQHQLDATELATWQRLLRVTSHEILNSLAPVSSCAQTAKALANDMLEGDIEKPALREDLEDLRDAVETMARRSEGLMRFVQSYRQLTRMPPPERRSIALFDWLRRLDSLLRGELAQQETSFACRCDPQDLIVQADENMLDQAVINLVRNAADAVAGRAQARIDVRAFVDQRQHVVVEVADNGSGIDEDTARNIFVPFFTTKQQGSGVGLALVRYIMLSHGGSATYTPRDGGGSIFRLVF